MSLLPQSETESVPRMPTVCLCAGGHARVVLDAVRSGDEFEVEAILDDDTELHGAMIHGAPVIGGLDSIPGVRDHGINMFVIGLGGTDHPERAARRIELFNSAVEAGLSPATVRHARSNVAQDVAIGAANVIFAGATLDPKVRLGVNVIINSGAILGPEVRVGDHSHIAPGAVIGAGAEIGARVHIGARAVIRSGAKIGDGAIVAMGAVVTDDVSAETTFIREAA